MQIDGKEYEFQEVSRVLTVPDCNVLGPNKIGTGNGEAKFYFGPKAKLELFSLGQKTLECFFLRSDLLKYMQTAEKEYKSPTHDYVGKSEMPQLWDERVKEISRLPEVIEFTVDIQEQITGDRGYLNSHDSAYKLFRTLSLPLISYISIMRLKGPKGNPLYYWRLFVDFDALAQRGVIPQVFSYGRGRSEVVPTENHEQQVCAEAADRTSGRDSSAQAKFRKKLFEECPFCPITMISDERLLVASHIKPYAVSEKDEAFDVKNGFTLSPLYDRLFDQGFISFDAKKCMMVSDWLSPANKERCRLKAGTFIQTLPLDEKRESYLKYHRHFVFKG